MEQERIIWLRGRGACGLELETPAVWNVLVYSNGVVFSSWRRMWRAHGPVLNTNSIRYLKVVKFTPDSLLNKREA